MAVPKFITNDMKGGYVGGPTTPARRCYVGGSLVYQGFGPASEQEFIQQEATGGPAELSKIYGKSIVWRQLVKNGTFTSTADWNAAGASSFTVSNGVASIVPNTQYQGISQTSTEIVSGHKYFVRGMLYQAAAAGAYIKGSLNGTNIVIKIGANTGVWKEAADILTAGTGSSSNIGVGSTLSSGFSEIKATGIVIIDLTLLYGAGNEPASVAAFLADYPNFDPTYDPGSLQSNKTTELRAYDGGTLRGSLALNLSTLTGKLNGEGASVVVYPDGLRGVGTDRDAAYGSTGEVARAVVDLGMLEWTYVAGKQIFTADSPNDSAEVVASYGISALCAKYSKTTADILWGGQSPDKSFVMNGGYWTSGKRIGIKDTAYTDAATFKTAMSGVMLDYPLATPLAYTLDTPLPTDLTCEQGDILQRVSDNNCPFVGEMRFGL